MGTIILKTTTKGRESGGASIPDGYIDKSKLSTDVQKSLTAADGSVRFDASQKLTVAQMEQVAANEGVPTVFMSETEFNKTLSDANFDKVASATRIIVKFVAGYQKIFDLALNATDYYSFLNPQNDAMMHRIIVWKSTKRGELVQYPIRDANAVRVVAQNFTSTQQAQGRTNIGAMANTPSGDPMHYMYETAGAEWIPYADISTEGLEDWQVATLNTAQAQADGGVWWHNDIFVTVAQNRINYVSTIGDYPANASTYIYYLKRTSVTTNYKENIPISHNISLTEAVRMSGSIYTVFLPTLKTNNVAYAFNNCAKLCRVIGVIDASDVSSFNGTFASSPNLRYVNIKGIKVNVNLGDNVKFSLNSLTYMITNAGTATLTITLAPAVYAAAMADTAVQAALASKPNVTLADAGATGGEN